MLNVVNKWLSVSPIFIILNAWRVLIITIKYTVTTAEDTILDILLLFILLVLFLYNLKIIETANNIM